MTAKELVQLPDYDELIGSLADRLEGLSVVRDALSGVTSEIQAARNELTQARLSTELVIVSGEELLGEVRRLEPTIVASTLRDGFADVSRDSAQNLDAIRARLSNLDLGLQAEHEHVDAVLAQLDERIAADLAEIAAQLSSISGALNLQQDQLSTRIDGLDRSLEAHGKQQASVLASCKTIQREQEAFTQRQETVIVPALEQAASNQAKLGEEHQALLTQLDYLNARQDVIAEREQRVAEVVARVQATVEATQLLSEATHRVVDQHAPIVISAIEATRRDVDKQLKFLRTAVIGLLALVLIVLVVAVVF